MKTSKKKIFLSHASKDKALADRLIELLTTGCDVSPNDILCTSEPGMGIPVGYRNFIEYLHGQMQKPALVILLLSENYFASHFCLCELGATWGGDLPSFPLVVPPTNKETLRATLLVTQACYVNSRDCLHELRDRIKDNLGKSVPTPLWDAKCRAFLKEVDEVIGELPAPSQVPKEELLAAKNEYEQAVQVIGAKEEEIRRLKAQIADLERLKDRQEVKAVAEKYSTTKKQFEQICREASAALDKLKPATRVALFCEQCGEEYTLAGQEAWDNADVAKAVQEIEVVEGEGPRVEIRHEHPRVKKAKKALGRLEEFLGKEKNGKFLDELEHDYEFPMNIENKDFWREFLSYV